MYKNNITVIIGLILIIGMIFYVFRKKRKETLDVENAAEMCKRISSESEKIAAHYGGISKVLQNLPLASLFNPGSYKAGDNSSTDMARNIVNTSMTSEEVLKVSNTCDASSAVVQLNEIDSTKCEFCIKNGCNLTNISQSNVSDNKQSCTITAAIDVLLKKSSNAQAMALGKTLQKAQDLMSGSNTAVSENCNILNTNVDAKTYTDVINRCSAAYSVNQKNYVANCGAVTNLVQKNISDNYQNCMIDSEVVNKSLMEAETKALAESTTEQSSTGISPWASAGSSLSCCIVSIALIAASYMFSQSESGKELISKAGAK
jgi:LPXTG-motif cell wall-anchored protein